MYALNKQQSPHWRWEYIVCILFSFAVQLHCGIYCILLGASEGQQAMEELISKSINLVHQEGKRNLPTLKSAVMAWFFVLSQLPAVVSSRVSEASLHPPVQSRLTESFPLLWEAAPPLLPVAGWEPRGEGEHSTGVAVEMEPETAEEWEALQEGVKCWAGLASKSLA